MDQSQQPGFHSAPVTAGNQPVNVAPGTPHHQSAPGRQMSPTMQHGLLALGAGMFGFELVKRIVAIGAPFALEFAQEILNELKDGTLLGGGDQGGGDVGQVPFRQQ
jgi:hypothetical protein